MEFNMEENNNNDRVLEFIKRRFSNTENANWLNGNCYYFAIILRERFDGEIYYDVINGHFLTLIKDKLYDYSGVVYSLTEEEMIRVNDCPLIQSLKLKEDLVIVLWSHYYYHDCLQKQRIDRDCIE